MKTLGLLDNPKREEIAEFFINITLRKACLLFIKSHPIDDERRNAKTFITLLQFHNILPARKSNGKSYTVGDFIYKQDHNATLSKIYDLDALSEDEAINSINVYEDLIAFLNEYLKDLLKSYGYDTTEAFPSDDRPLIMS